MITAAYQIQSLFEDKRDIPVGFDSHFSVRFLLDFFFLKLKFFFLYSLTLIVVIVMKKNVNF